MVNSCVKMTTRFWSSQSCPNNTHYLSLVILIIIRQWYSMYIIWYLLIIPWIGIFNCYSFKDYRFLYKNIIIIPLVMANAHRVHYKHHIRMTLDKFHFKEYEKDIWKIIMVYKEHNIHHSSQGIVYSYIWFESSIEIDLICSDLYAFTRSTTMLDWISPLTCIVKIVSWVPQNVPLKVFIRCLMFFKKTPR